MLPSSFEALHSHAGRFLAGAPQLTRVFGTELVFQLANSDAAGAIMTWTHDEQE